MANKSNINSSTSFLKDINLKVTPVKMDSGADSYAISGILSTDVIVFSPYLYSSDGGLVSAGVATVSNSGKTGSVAISGVVLTGGVTLVGWFDVSE